MKKTIFLSLLSLIFSMQLSRAQGMPVYDNTNFLALGQSLIESAKQTSELFKTVNFLREQKERIEQVSSVIAELRAAREIISNNQELYNRVQNELRDILASPYISNAEVDRISESFNRLIEQALYDIEFLQGLLTSGYLKMTDSERLEIMEAQRLRSRAMTEEVALKTRRYQDLIDFRRITQAINQREAQY